MLDFSFLILLGLNLGGTMPFPMPNTITNVESYSPKLFPSIGVDALKLLGEKSGVSAGLRFENKGMKSTASVKEYSMKFGDFDGRFNGIVETEMNFNYVGLPILAHYMLAQNVSVYAGAYYAYLLNGEFKGATKEGGYLYNVDTGSAQMNREEYDFSNELRNYDIGLSLGLSYLPYNERFLLSFDFNYGLMPIFPSSFNGVDNDMQNVYAKLSVGYLF